MGEIEFDNIVDVDLTGKTVKITEVPLEWREKYIGGTGINTKILYDSGAMNYDALSEHNVLIFGIGPTVGTGLMSGNRCTITAKSPLTDIYGDSSTGGNLTIQMKAYKVNHIVLRGKSEKPVYLLAHDNGEMTIESADKIWGMKVLDAVKFLESKHGSCEIACIGPAGENLVRFASIITSKRHAAGRMGMGCVMGSKKVKAIVFPKKPLKVTMYDPNKIKAINKCWLHESRNSMLTKNENINGSLFLFKQYNKVGSIPVMNCQSGSDKRIENLYPEKFNSKYVTKKESCYGCPVGCGRQFEVKSGKYKGEKGAGMDYGAAVSIGPALGIFNWDEVIHLKLLINEYGMDAIELGGVLSMILECSERNLLPQYRSFKFGSIDDAEYLINALTYREGIGDILAEGVYRAAKTLHLEKYAMCIKKSSTGAHSKKRLAFSLGYLTSTRGGDHLKDFPFTMLFPGYFSDLVAKYIFNIDPQKYIDKPEKQGRVVWWHENYKTAIDALGLCIFSMHSLPNMGHGYFREFSQILNALYGLKMKDIDVFYASERIYQMQNAFNINSGMSISDYKWPKRNPDKNIDKNYLSNTVIEVLNEPGMLPEYFKYRGLSDDGKPTKHRFQELGMDDVLNTIKSDCEDNGFHMDDALKTVNLNADFNLFDNVKVHFLSKLLVKMLDKKYKKAVAAHQKAALSKNSAHKNTVKQ
jgi:aldehyde:ferredoxin oxidoreductase